MNIASIDIGSNTVLLLIAKIENNKLFPLLNLYESPRLGKGLKPGGLIQKDKIDELFKVLTKYKSVIKENYCEKIIVTATNAMRIAINSSDIIELVKEKYGLNIQVISGEEEAKLSFLGSTYDLGEYNLPKTVIDIGGGSTEIINGIKNKIIFKKSFGVGAVNLTELFSINEFDKIRNLKEIDQYLTNIFKKDISIIPPKIKTIAVAGTPTTLSCIKQNLKDYNEKMVEGSQLTVQEIKHLFQILSLMKPNKIKLKFGNVVKGREDVILAGTIILKNLMDFLNVDRIYVSGKGLRYGNIINYMNQLK